MTLIRSGLRRSFDRSLELPLDRHCCRTLDRSRTCIYSVGEVPTYVFSAPAWGELVRDQSRVFVGDGPMLFRTHLDAEPFCAINGRPLPELVLDLLHFAHSVYISDRLALRDPRSGPSGEGLWQRKMDLTVAVDCIGIWSNPAVKRRAEAALEFLTGDSWTISFTPRSASDERNQWSNQGRVAAPDIPVFPDTVALFSGGLDSFAGTTSHLCLNRGRHLSVAACTHNRLRSVQLELLAELRKHLGIHSYSIVIGHGFREKDDGIELESSQRARGFFHFCLAAAAARLGDLTEVSVYENGIGAFNLPMDLSQIGAQTSRAVHPVFVALMEDLFTEIFAGPFRINHPFLFRTKGEVVALMTGTPLTSMLSRTVSCDRYPDHYENAEQCGVCPSCLLRRLSVRAAGLASKDLVASYALTMESQRRSVMRRRFAFQKMDSQVSQFAILLARDQVRERFISAYPTLRLARRRWLTHGYGPDQFVDSLLALYGRYVDEWARFSSQIEPQRQLPLVE